MNILKDNLKYLKLLDILNQIQKDKIKDNYNEKNNDENENNKKNTLVEINNINFGAKVNFAYNILKEIKEFNGNMIYVVANEKEALQTVEEFKFYTPNVSYFPQKEIKSFNILTENQDIFLKRMELLNLLVNNTHHIFVLTIEGYIQILIEKSKLVDKKYMFRLGDTIDLDKTISKLINLGYVLEDIAENMGEISKRGGIIDIAYSQEEGLRIELFGDEIESLRIYDLDTQKSKELISKFEIDKINENILEDQKDRVIKYLETKQEDIYQGKVKKQAEELELDLEKLKNNRYHTIIEKYIDVFMDKIENFSQYISPKDIVIISDTKKCNLEISKVFEKAKKINNSLEEKRRQKIQSISHFKPDIFPEIDKILKKNVQLILLEELDNNIKKELLDNSVYDNIDIINCDFKILPYILPEVDVYKVKQALLEKQKNNTNSIEKKEEKILLKDIYLNSIVNIIDSLLENITTNEKIYLICGTGQNKVFEILKTQLKKLGKQNIYIQNLKNINIGLNENTDNVEVLEDYASSVSKNASKIMVLNGNISKGYMVDNIKVIYLGEFFKKKESRKIKNTSKLTDIVFADLTTGDYVVHKTHGIGKFKKIESKTVFGTIKDYIMLEYANNDKLYIPTDDLSNIKKYIGKDAVLPKLSRLGTKDWETLTKRVKKSLRTVARELVELYHKREHIKGYACLNDTTRQYQFENEFPYIETEDQLRCIKEVKQDMERTRPMERLLCGDVGFGKTEVALRAAFKATENLKQVAYIVPTTVLARQQYLTFKQRMEEYGVKVCEFNRFKSKKQVEEILKEISNGKIDVVIGTHRILSKDVKFYDLGLLIIDEEHRFGVKDKEKLKILRNDVDVLSMTATPIPRTMQMSLSGIRDMSIIYDAPQDRLPVKTYVVEYDDEIIKNAILNEVDRNGQVIYLHNKVRDIEFTKTYLEKILPNVRFDIAHGQMTGNQIENKMQEFVNGDIQVLICTTIVESGIDIPNANTIIVEEADKLGLAQLYQIRGRVGRGKREAYAYITFKKNKEINEIAEKRLKAIKEFTELGSGFKIATRDLEIRGAGSVFGEVQSGHMLQVGYETYSELLNESIKEIKKEEGISLKSEEEKIKTIVDINVDSYIPDTYIKKTKYKIEIYQQLINEESDLELDKLKTELMDRYGKFPKELENFIQILKIRNIATILGITKILQGKNEIIQDNIYMHINNKFKKENIELILNKYIKAIKLQKSKEKDIDGIIVLNLLEFAKMMYNMKEWEENTENITTTFGNKRELKQIAKLELIQIFLRGLLENE